MTTAAVIFDLDGTLLDSLMELADAGNAALASLGAPAHPRDAYRGFVGDGMANLARRALPQDRRDQTTVERMVRAMRAAYETRWARSRPYPGVGEMLDALAARGLPAMVLSNKPDPFTRRIVDHALGRWPWVAVRGALPGAPLKPDPSAALDLAADLGLDPAALALVGDSDVDVATAKAAGMTAVGAAWGFRGRRELEAAGADLILERPGDLPARLPWRGGDC